ncbi:MAG: hypothetical protein ACTS22_08845 [Phycisphaerales bacterium]
MPFRLRASSGSDDDVPRTIAYLSRFGSSKTAARVARTIRDRQSARSSAGVLVLGITGIVLPTLVGIAGSVLFIELFADQRRSDMTTVEGIALILIILACAGIATPFFILADRVPDLLARRSARRHAAARRCIGCRYDMASHAGDQPTLALCPECGSPTPVAATHRPRTITP